MVERDGFLARQPAAVDSAFAVLEKVAELGPGTTARQLVDSLPMSKATIYRIVQHLSAHEYLVRTPDLTGLMLGRRVLALAQAGALDVPPPVEEAAAKDAAAGGRSVASDDASGDGGARDGAVTAHR